MEIHIKDICNLSRIPICVEKNPLYLTSLQLLENKNINFKDTYLFEFHKKFKPKTLGELYGIQSKNFPILNYSYDTVFGPWLYKLSSNSIIRDVAFIDFNVEEKVLKLKKLISSFIKHGYIPEKFPTRQGQICGHFLEHKNKKKFYITAGNHRCAVYAAVFKNKKLPVIFEDKTFLKQKELKNRGPVCNIYSSKNIDEWVGVKNNNLSRACALQILERYFNN